MILIDHYSDVLCVWAYIAHARSEELEQNFGGQINTRWHYIPVFGDVEGKFAKQWQERGGAAGYAAHVREVIAGFDHVDMHADTWTKTQPKSSAPAHLYLCAARLASQDGDIQQNAEAELGWAMRQGFFQQAINIGEQAGLNAVLEQANISQAAILERVNNGSAYAALCNDMQKARDANIRVSPSYVFNEDRQRLTGNVGYRIIEANVRELLEQPQTQQSWC